MILHNYVDHIDYFAYFNYINVTGEGSVMTRIYQGLKAMRSRKLPKTRSWRFKRRLTLKTS